MEAVISAIQNFFNENIIDVVLETAQILPDGLVIMTGLYALLTLSASFAVMFGGLVEAAVVFQLIQSMALYLGVAEGAASDAKCRTGFRTPDLTTLSMFSRDLKPAFPSAPLYILSVASAYIFSSLSAQSEELQALGTAYSSRYYISICLLCTLILVFMLFRLYSGCDSFSVTIASVPIGLAIGAIIFEQNRRLFGPTMVNLLGIPLIANKATISVCKATT
jgi:hypothetical protein